MEGPVQGVEKVCLIDIAWRDFSVILVTYEITSAGVTAFVVSGDALLHSNCLSDSACNRTQAKND